MAERGTVLSRARCSSSRTFLFCLVKKNVITIVVKSYKMKKKCGERKGFKNGFSPHFIHLIPTSGDGAREEGRVDN